MDFPLLDLLDDEACYDFLVESLHPKGLRCHFYVQCRTPKSFQLRQ